MCCNIKEREREREKRRERDLVLALHASTMFDYGLKHSKFYSVACVADKLSDSSELST